MLNYVHIVAQKNARYNEICEKLLKISSDIVNYMSKCHKNRRDLQMMKRDI